MEVNVEAALKELEEVQLGQWAYITRTDLRRILLALQTPVTEEEYKCFWCGDGRKSNDKEAPGLGHGLISQKEDCDERRRKFYERKDKTTVAGKEEFKEAQKALDKDFCDYADRQGQIWHAHNIGLEAGKRLAIAEIKDRFDSIITRTDEWI